MTSGESPAVARRRLRLALRKAREDAGFTQGQVAYALDWSLSKVQRIESVDFAVSTTDLLALLSYLGIDDAQEKSQLQEIAKRSRRKGWWDEPEIREHLNSSTLQYLAFENEATMIRNFHPTLLPGLIQTHEYAKHIIDFWDDELSEDVRTVRLEVRMRRKQVLDRPDPPEYLLVLDESVLLRSIGGPLVMADQLDELMKLMNRPNFTARIVPLAAGAQLATLNPFIVIDLGDEENAILYREAYLVDEVVQAPDKIRLYRGRFEDLWHAALSPEQSMELIREHAKGMRQRVSEAG